MPADMTPGEIFAAFLQGPTGESDTTAATENEAGDTSPRAPRPDPNQGRKTDPIPLTPAEEFARFVNPRY